MEIYEVKIVGTRPLLMHAPVELESKPKLRRGEHLEPKVEAEKYLYKDDEGNIVIPAVNVKACIRDAGANYKVSGRRSTFKSMIKAGLDVQPFPYIPLLVPTMPQHTTSSSALPDHARQAFGWRIATNKDFQVDIRPVVVQRARILRSRPRFDNWALEFRIANKDPTVIHKDILNKILVDAGKYYGLGDFRPEYGLFKVEKFE